VCVLQLQNGKSETKPLFRRGTQVHLSNAYSQRKEKSGERRQVEEWIRMGEKNESEGSKM
jgi:hypothetical protein